MARPRSARAWAAAVRLSSSAPAGVGTLTLTLTLTLALALTLTPQVNKGPKSAGVVASARANGYLAVRGNHDDSLLFAHEKREAARARGHVPQDDEKYAYADELSTEDAQYLRSLPYTISLPTLDALVVHAGLVPGVALEAQDPAGMYTMRNLV